MEKTEMTEALAAVATTSLLKLNAAPREEFVGCEIRWAPSHSVVGQLHKMSSIVPTEDLDYPLLVLLLPYPGAEQAARSLATNCSSSALGLGYEWQQVEHQLDRGRCGALLIYWTLIGRE